MKARSMKVRMSVKSLRKERWNLSIVSNTDERVEVIYHGKRISWGKDLIDAHWGLGVMVRAGVTPMELRWMVHNWCFGHLWVERALRD